MATDIPFLDLRAAHEEVREEIAAGFDRVLSTTAFAGGPDVAVFERAFAAFSGREHCIGMANGTDALELAFRALGIGPGDEVVIPANTFVATAEAVLRAGATPVPVDVDADTMLVDVAAMEAAVGPRTAALCPVHLYGQLADMAAVQRLAARHGLAVVEDAAQAQGASRDGRTIGTGSDAASTSFYPGKNLGAYGDAGAVVTDTADLADLLRMLGNHGSRVKYVHEVLGFNSRLDTLQAVVLNAKLGRLEAWNRARRQVAERYAGLLSGLDVQLPVTAAGNVHVWHLFVVRVAPAMRDAVLADLSAAGIGTGVHYPTPIHLHEGLRSLGFGLGAFPVAEAAAGSMISLPMFPNLGQAQQERIASSLGRALTGGQFVA